MLIPITNPYFRPANEALEHAYLTRRIAVDTQRWQSYKKSVQESQERPREAERAGRGSQTPPAAVAAPFLTGISTECQRIEVTLESPTQIVSYHRDTIRGPLERITVTFEKEEGSPKIISRNPHGTRRSCDAQSQSVSKRKVAVHEDEIA